MLERHILKHEKSIDSSLSAEDLLVQLHEAGASPVDAIRTLMAGKKMSLADAKAMLSRSPSWQTENAIADALHNEVLNEPGFKAVDDK